MRPYDDTTLAYVKDMQFFTDEKSWKRFGNEFVSKRVLKMVTFLEINLGCEQYSVLS